MAVCARQIRCETWLAHREFRVISNLLSKGSGKVKANMIIFLSRGSYRSTVGGRGLISARHVRTTGRAQTMGPEYGPLWLSSFSLMITFPQPSPQGNQNPHGLCHLKVSWPHQFPGIHCMPAPTVADPLLPQLRPGGGRLLARYSDQLLSCQTSCYPVSWSGVIWTPSKFILP